MFHPSAQKRIPSHEHSFPNQTWFELLAPTPTSEFPHPCPFLLRAQMDRIMLFGVTFIFFIFIVDESSPITI